MVSLKPIDDAVFRTLVSSVIAQRNDPDWNFTELCQEVCAEASHRCLVETSEGSSQEAPSSASPQTLAGLDFARVVNVVRDLIEDGLVRPGRWQVTTPDDPSAWYLPHFHVTEAGFVRFAIFKKGIY